MRRKALGVAMLVLLFISMFAFGICVVGYARTLIAIGVSIAVAAYCTFAAYLIRTGAAP